MIIFALVDYFFNLSLRKTQHVFSNTPDKFGLKNSNFEYSHTFTFLCKLVSMFTYVFIGFVLSLLLILSFITLPPAAFSESTVFVA